MLATTPSLGTQVPYRVSEFATSHTGLSRLFSAAVVNGDFRSHLLRDPDAAISAGYHGQQFTLTAEERSLVVSIRADSLADLARKVNRAMR